MWFERDVVRVYFRRDDGEDGVHGFGDHGVDRPRDRSRFGESPDQGEYYGDGFVNDCQSPSYCPDQAVATE